MPLIKRKEKIERTSFSVSMDEKLASQLRAYSEYTNVGISEIIEAAVRYAINSDVEFTNGSVHKEPRMKSIEPKVKSAEKAA